MQRGATLIFVEICDKGYAALHYQAIACTCAKCVSDWTASGVIRCIQRRR